MSKIIIKNTKDMKLKNGGGHNQYQYQKHAITKRSEFDQAYVMYIELPPLKETFPYHYHEINTECFYIISGTGILRTNDGDRVISEGDVIVCPPGEKGAHKISNNSTKEPLKYIDFATTNSPDKVTYPDSKKTGVIVHNESATFYNELGEIVNYYDGE